MPTPAVFQVEPLDQAPMVVASSDWSSEPAVPARRYSDLYGNRCQRMVLPAGRSQCSYERAGHRARRDRGLRPSAPELAPHDLPDDVLVYLMPSRYCLPDMLGNEAWSRFSAVPPGYSRVQAICQHVNDHLQFAYGSSGPTSTAVDVNASGFGVCRDFTHLAITVLPGDEHPGPVCVRVPAGHGRADRPEPDGLRGVDGGLAGRPVVDLRSAEQPPAQGPRS